MYARRHGARGGVARAASFTIVRPSSVGDAELPLGNRLFPELATMSWEDVLDTLPKATADNLWVLLDSDKSGTVSRAEFSSALRNMQQARAWLRYCPTCEFRNDCAYCHECNTDCTKCTEEDMFHPGEPRSRSRFFCLV